MQEQPTPALTNTGVDKPDSAAIYTFDEQVRRQGEDPFAYLEWVFGKLLHDPAPEELPNLLPAAWLKAEGEPATEDDTAVA